MCNYWANFIATGDPNGKDADGSDMPYCDCYTPEHRTEMLFTGKGPVVRTNQESEFTKLVMEQIGKMIGRS